MNARFECISTSAPYKRIDSETNEKIDGLSNSSARCFRKSSDSRIYILVFTVLGIVQSAYFGYFIGVITTVEKRYRFRSQLTGIILIADCISLIFLTIIIKYFDIKVCKRKFITTSLLLVVLSCFLSGLPYFIYGPGTHILLKAGETIKSAKLEYCEKDHEDDLKCEASNSSAVNPVVVIMFLANFLNGFGVISFLTIGIPGILRNVEAEFRTFYFSAMSALRIFGPVFGFLLSSFCLKYYEDPFYDPGIDTLNPRWVGAWWMGFLFLGVILLFFTILLVLFPRELPERFRSEKNNAKNKDEKVKDAGLPKFKDFPQELRRLAKNPILVCHVISITFQVNGFLGYFVFMPKFVEAQYLKSASDSSLYSGTTGIVSMLFGILLGGSVVMKYKPRPRYLTGYMVLVEIFSVVGLMISIFLGCSPIQMPGTNLREDDTLNLYNECNIGCGCTRRLFEPVCGEDGISTFFSPCFAGCPNMTGIQTSSISTTISSLSNATIFEACKCASGLNNTFVTKNVTSGYCSTECNMFIVYIIILCISKFISSTARVGNTLITFRCVEAKDKSFALGVFGSVLSMFAFIPYPLIYGALTDSACLVWEESCSKTGNCWLYDTDKFRYYLHGMSMLLISIGICFDGMVFLLSDRMTNFYGEDDEKPQGEDRIARWLKEEEEEDVIFTKCPKKPTLIEIDPVL